jgi:hypothetical protein
VLLGGGTMGLPLETPTAAPNLDEYVS